MVDNCKKWKKYDFISIHLVDPFCQLDVYQEEVVRRKYAMLDFREALEAT